MMTKKRTNTTNYLLSRRETLRLMGAAGSAALLGLGDDLWPAGQPVSVVEACSHSNVVSPTLFSVSPKPLPVDASSLSCVVRPAQMEGPYFIDEKINRSDIRTDPTNNSVKQGAPLSLKINVSRVSGGSCAAVTGAYVDIWQCDAQGVYSDVRDFQGQFDTRGQKFLRGYQLTDKNGTAEFTTIYPGWYAGRTAHLHIKIRLFAGDRKTYEYTSQLYFDDAITDQVYTQDPYKAKGFRTTRNDRDGLFRRGNSGSQLMLNLTQNAKGYVGTFDIGLSEMPVAPAHGRR